jgi:hypothetical protein
MDVEKGNVGMLLRKVVKKAHPDVVEGLISGLSPADVASVSDATSVFNLFDSVYCNARAPAALVQQCLQFGWQLATSPDTQRFVMPTADSAAHDTDKDGRRISGSGVIDDNTVEANQMPYSIIRAEGEWGSTHGRLEGSDSFVISYVHKCLELIKETKHLPTALKTLYFLLHTLSHVVRLHQHCVLLLLLVLLLPCTCGLCDLVNTCEPVTA